MNGWLAAVAVILVGCGSREPERPSASIHLGLWPFFANIPNRPCTEDPNREAVMFEMDDENDDNCSSVNGLRDELWSPPSATRYPFPEPCMPQEPSTSRLYFCRTNVALEAFKPLTTDPTAVEQFYAVLKFDEACPPGSVEISKKIINEDSDNQNRFEGAIEPNEMANDLFGNYTRLHFCYFQAAHSEDDTMRDFPELGFSYAVFHDFDGPQPDWVVRKRWIYSDDSNNDKQNRYTPELASAAELAPFQSIIENPLRNGTHDTCFDLALVR